MKRSLIVLFLVLTVGAYASGRPDPSQIQGQIQGQLAGEELDVNNPAAINIVETYPDENIYNAIGKNTVRSGQPEEIYTIFDDLRRSYSRIIIRWEFVPVNGTSIEGVSTAAVDPELITFAKNHLGLSNKYDIVETYDPSMASIVLMVECQLNKSPITDKVTLSAYNFTYKLITPKDQIIVGESSASIVKENFHDPQAMKIGEKILVDVWF